jgi:hypothetical protein
MILVPAYLLGLVGAALLLAFVRTNSMPGRALYWAAITALLGPTIVAGGGGAGIGPIWYAALYYISDARHFTMEPVIIVAVPFLVIWGLLLGISVVTSRLRRRSRSTP